MVLRSGALCLYVLGFLVISLAECLAECSSPGFNPGKDFCNNCRYEAVLTVGRDQACERLYRPNGPAHAAIVGNRVVQRARHGMAGVNGNVLAYQPSKSYVGQEKREPVSDIDIAEADSLKVLDLKRPIRTSSRPPACRLRAIS